MKILWLVVATMLAGCASTRPVSPTEARQQEGRIVESLVLANGRIVVFDDWESASSGRDNRARVRGEVVEGYVDGAFSRYSLEDIRELHLGADDSGRTKAVILVGVPLVIAGALVALFLATFDLGLN